MKNLHPRTKLSAHLATFIYETGHGRNLRSLRPAMAICTRHSRRSSSRPSLFRLLCRAHGNPRHARKNRPARRDRCLFERGQPLIASDRRAQGTHATA